MDHELSMAHAANKRLKYETRLKKIEGNQCLKALKLQVEFDRLEALKLQLELDHLRTSTTYSILDTAPAHVSTTSWMSPVHIHSDGPSNGTTISGISENTSVSLHPSKVFSPVSLQNATPSDIHDFPQSSFDF